MNGRLWVLESVPTADIVLVGVSRSSKTPVSMYLAQRGYKVANIPIVPDQAGGARSVPRGFTLDSARLHCRAFIRSNLEIYTLQLLFSRRHLS